CGKKGDILMVEVLFPPVTRRARNKNKSEMNRCLPIWLSRPTSHQPSPELIQGGTQATPRVKTARISWKSLALARQHPEETAEPSRPSQPSGGTRPHHR